MCENAQRTCTQHKRPRWAQSTTAGRCQQTSRCQQRTPARLGNAQQHTEVAKAHHSFLCCTAKNHKCPAMRLQDSPKPPSLSSVPSSSNTSTHSLQGGRDVQQQHTYICPFFSCGQTHIVQEVAHAQHQQQKRQQQHQSQASCQNLQDAPQQHVMPKQCQHRRYLQEHQGMQHPPARLPAGLSSQTATTGTKQHAHSMHTASTNTGASG
jgi:hypothetical protein